MASRVRVLVEAAREALRRTLAGFILGDNLNSVEL